MKPSKPILKELMCGICLIAIAVLLFASCKKGASTENLQISKDDLQETTLNTAGGNHNDSTVTICNQVWMVKNLDVSTYRDGTPIPQVTDSTAWADATFGAYCYYKNDSATYGTVYGKLYNWYAATDTVHGGIAPIGWHVPTDDEWTTLTNCLGGQAVAGGKMKEKGTKHWLRPNLDATNSSGFTALPGGIRYNVYDTFEHVRELGWWWTTTETGIPPYYPIWAREIGAGDAGIYMAYAHRNLGISVRCIKD